MSTPNAYLVAAYGLAALLMLVEPLRCALRRRRAAARAHELRMAAHDGDEGAAP